jgi:hypothetical protein
MKSHVALLCLPFLLLTLARGENTVVTKETGKESFEAEFPSAGELHVDLRSGEVVIKGTDESKVRVHFEGVKSGDFGDVEVRLKTAGSKGELSIRGGPRNGFRMMVEVPKVVDLHLRMPFGDATVKRLTGSKDIEIHAGDLTIDIGEASAYGHVDASVLSGDLDATPFNVSKGGLFRSFEKEAGGKYRLHAHVGAGDLTLQE